MHPPPHMTAHDGVHGLVTRVHGLVTEEHGEATICANPAGVSTASTQPSFGHTFPLTVGTADTENDTHVSSSSYNTEDVPAIPQESRGELSEREEERGGSEQGRWRRLDPFKCSAALQEAFSQMLQSAEAEVEQAHATIRALEEEIRLLQAGRDETVSKLASSRGASAWAIVVCGELVRVMQMILGQVNDARRYV